VNDTFCNLTGYTREEIIGHTANDLNLWVNSEDRLELFRLLTNDSLLRNYEFEFRTKSGLVRTALLSAEVINIGGEECLLAISNDITKRKRAVHLGAAPFVMSFRRTFVLFWFLYELPDLVAALEEFREYSQGIILLRDKDLPGRVWYRGQPEWMADVSAESTDSFLRAQLAKKCGIKAGVAVPIIVEDRSAEIPKPKVLAVLAFFMLSSCPEVERIFKLVSSVAAQLGTAMQQKQSTAELRGLFAAMTDAIVAIDAQGHYLKVAPTSRKFLSQPESELIGKTLHEIFDRDRAFRGCIPVL